VVDALFVLVIVEREAGKVETDRCMEVEGSFPCPHRSSVVCTYSYSESSECGPHRHISFKIFEVLTAMVPNIRVFWDVTLCRCVKSFRRFERS
jgi:hypothetical protein